jgi:hypothetical protein
VSRLPAASALAAALLAAVPARALDTVAPPPTEPGTHVTLLWAALQLIPSPEAVIWDGVARLGARWQITPLLYSWGINRKLSPWRTFVAEPTVRHAGSIELHVSPEVLAGSFPRGEERWLLRTGLRSYVPLIHRGEALSTSVGGSLVLARGKVGAGVDLGLHTFGGLVGLRAGACPTPGLRFLTLGLEIRIF